MSKITMDDMLRTGPGTIGGRYMRRFWQPLMRSEDLNVGQAKPARIMSQDFTVYRGESGKAHIVDARCAHRRTFLHTGWVEGETIRCIYHGYRYDCSGQCVEAPGEHDALVKHTKIPAYPTEEYLGLIWGYFGEESPTPPMRRYPDYERPGLISTSLPEIWPCNFFNRIDNGPDIMHVPFTHKETFTRSVKQIGSGFKTLDVLPDLDFNEREYGLETIVIFDERKAYFHFLMPNTNMIAGTLGRSEGPVHTQEVWRQEMFIRVPVDDENSISFPIVLLDLHGEDAERYLEERDKTRAEFDPLKLVAETSKEVMAGRMHVRDIADNVPAYYSFLVEDFAGQVGQGPMGDRENERLGRADRGMVMLRRMWMRELQALADGEPLKEWVTPPGLADRTEPQPSWAARQQTSTNAVPVGE